MPGCKQDIRFQKDFYVERYLFPARQIFFIFQCLLFLGILNYFAVGPARRFIDIIYPCSPVLRRIGSYQEVHIITKTFIIPGKQVLALVFCSYKRLLPWYFCQKIVKEIPNIFQDRCFISIDICNPSGCEIRCKPGNRSSEDTDTE